MRRQDDDLRRPVKSAALAPVDPMTHRAVVLLPAPMSRPVATIVAFLGGFLVMVLEIVGMRLLARDFGGSFYVWTSQIGVVLVALTAGYVAGGYWADRASHVRPLAGLLVAAGVFTVFLPAWAGPLTHAIVGRHPSDAEIPLLWQKLDPALGATFVFLPPCFVLALLPPFLIRHAAKEVREIGRISGSVYGAGSAGSIAGVFVSGYLLVDAFALSSIFRGSGVLMIALAATVALAGGRRNRNLESQGFP